MKKLFFILFIIPFSSLAADKFHRDIAKSAEVDNCIRKYNSENIECLDDAISHSESALNHALQKKLAEIDKVDPEKWWMGNEQQKKVMIQNLKKNQQEWIDYRNNYCGVALSTFQNLDSLGEVQTSCQLNMNLRRIEEINMIDVQPDS